MKTILLSEKQIIANWDNIKREKAFENINSPKTLIDRIRKNNINFYGHKLIISNQIKRF